MYEGVSRSPSFDFTQPNEIAAFEVTSTVLEFP